jgi:hypothetical protein
MQKVLSENFYIPYLCRKEYLQLRGVGGREKNRKEKRKRRKKKRRRRKKKNMS